MIRVEDLPIGFRFMPTDEQLIRCYLEKKVNGMPVPENVIREVGADEFYSKPPCYLAGKAHDERGFYFFIYNEQYFHGEFEKVREVGNGIGIWRSCGYEEPVYDRNGNIIACKIGFEYFSTHENNGKKISWALELYRLIYSECKEDQKKEEWVIGRFKEWE